MVVFKRGCDLTWARRKQSCSGSGAERGPIDCEIASVPAWSEIEGGLSRGVCGQAVGVEGSA